MPLLGKEKFTLKTLNPDLKPDDEIFYCTITGEAFEDYNEFFERQILCSSLLWTCSVTGKTGLTYSEALKSEQESQSLLSSIPRILQKVLLHLMTYLNNFSTNVTMSILLEFTNLRYFIGESVQILPKNKSRRLNGIIRDVVPPNEYDPSLSIAYGIDPLLYSYRVEIIDLQKKSDGDKLIEIMPASRISRSKCSLTREKIRLFLKQHLSPKNSRYEILSIKEESIHKFGLTNLKWEDIFKGPIPNFNTDTTLVKAFNKDKHRLADGSEVNDSNDDSNLVDSDISLQILKKKSNLISSQKLKLIKREEKYKVSESIEKVKKSLKKSKLKKLKLQGKSKLAKKKTKCSSQDPPATPKLSKAEERNREKESRRKFEEDVRLWMEKRDDLLCDDLAPLPIPTPFKCDIDDDLIGDCLLILDFINTFHEYIAFENENLSFISFDFFLKLLSDSNVNGYYGQLLISLLNTILMSYRDEREIDNENNLMISENHDDLDLFNNEEDDNSSNLNIFSNYYIASYFGNHESLMKFNLDPFSLTEIVRLYIYKARNSASKKILSCEKDLIEKLSLYSVFDLDKVERLCLFKLLLCDIVKIPQIRQKIENSMEEMFRLKTQIRHLNASYTRWLRENPIRQRIRRKKKPDDSEQQQPEEQTETTVEEKEQYKKDKNEKELQMKNSISELKAKIRKLSAFCRCRPLGMDRSYRKYWIFQSIPGLLVEHAIDEFPPRSCLTSTVPMSKPKLTDYLPNAKRRRRKTISSLNQVEEEKPAAIESYSTIFDRCSGDPNSCCVHGRTAAEQTIRWSFYTKVQLENLINSLNSRGFRENELKNALIYERQSILNDHLQNFDPTIFNNIFVDVNDDCCSESSETSTTLRKSERIQNSNKESEQKPLQDLTILDDKYNGFSPFNAHQAAFKEELENLEFDIFNGCFTSFTLIDRENWCKMLPTTFFDDHIQSLTIFTSIFRNLVESIKPFCLLSPLSVYQDSAGSSPSDKENIENASYTKPKIPILSEKWIDVLKVPLKLSLNEISSLESSYGITSFSQLFINIYLLKKCINWDMSAMKRANKCRICRRKANEQLILCDMCNYGYHIYCLKPPLDSINESEDWFCYNCVPRVSVLPTKEEHLETQETKQLTDNYYDIPETETNNNENLFDKCKQCKKLVMDSFSEVICKVCNYTFHLKCVKLVRVPRSWACVPCEANQRYEQRHNSPNSDDNSDLRRSTRKRKPNLHYEDFDGVDEQIFYSSNTKSRRYSDDNDNIRKSSRRINSNKLLQNQLSSVEVTI